MRTKILILGFVIAHCTFIIEDCLCQWVQMSNGIVTGANVTSFAVYENNIFAGTFMGVWLSTNNGQNWTQAGLDILSIHSIAISGNNIFAGSYMYGVYLSTNNGQIWNQTALNNKNVYDIAISGNNIFAGTNNYGVWLSTNNGQNWMQTALNNQSVLCLAISGNNIFAGTNNGVLLSTNNGQNWIQTALNMNHLNVLSLAISGNNIFAGTYNYQYRYGVWLSTNNGQIWSQTTLNNQHVSSLAINGNNIFAGTLDSGVFISTNSGQNWIEKNQGFIVNPLVRALLIVNDYIFAGTEYSVWRRSLSEIIGIKNISTEFPSAFSLEQNYPNPFNSNTIIRFQIKDSRFVNLKVFDILGKEVATLVNEYLQPGTYETTFDASTLSGGIYFYRLQTENYTATKKLILLK
ncbi:MAG: T9SS type A sorting domain-containing protein [Ignavibacteria bacterium]|nr:T9SS type A sorting domain-containing protein [Ignavibacteria bacterium]